MKTPLFYFSVVMIILYIISCFVPVIYVLSVVGVLFLVVAGVLIATLNMSDEKMAKLDNYLKSLDK